MPACLQDAPLQHPATGSTRPADCDILQPLTASADSSINRIYLLVVICEVAVVGGLWLLDRFYS